MPEVFFRPRPTAATSDAHHKILDAIEADGWPPMEVWKLEFSRDELKQLAEFESRHGAKLGDETYVVLTPQGEGKPHKITVVTSNIPAAENLAAGR